MKRPLDGFGIETVKNNEYITTPHLATVQRSSLLNIQTTTHV
jgi:hypothetical protein